MIVQGWLQQNLPLENFIKKISQKIKNHHKIKGLLISFLRKLPHKLEQYTQNSAMGQLHNLRSIKLQKTFHFKFILRLTFYKMEKSLNRKYLLVLSFVMNLTKLQKFHLEFVIWLHFHHLLLVFLTWTVYHKSRLLVLLLIFSTLGVD